MQQGLGEAGFGGGGHGAGPGGLGLSRADEDASRLGFLFLLSPQVFFLPKSRCLREVLLRSLPSQHSLGAGEGDGEPFLHAAVLHPTLLPCAIACIWQDPFLVMPVLYPLQLL